MWGAEAPAALTHANPQSKVSNHGGTEEGHLVQSQRGRRASSARVHVGNTFVPHTLGHRWDETVCG